MSSTVKSLKGLGGWKRALFRDKHFLAQCLGQITVLYYTGLFFPFVQIFIKTL